MRSILGFFIGREDGTKELQRGHLGFVFEAMTYNKQPGHAAANILGVDEDVAGGDDGGGGGDDERFFMFPPFSALSRACLTLSRVQTLW